MDILYATNDAQVHRHSSLGQFAKYLSVYKKGGWAPILFDQLDGIACESVKSHPVIIDFGDPVGYQFPEGHCAYSSDHFLTVDKVGVEDKPLPKCFGGEGEFYQEYINANAFVNFDNGTSLGVHNQKTLRTGLSYCLSDETLPAVD